MPLEPVPVERFAQFRRYGGVAVHPNGDLLYTTDLTGSFNLWRQPVDAAGNPGYPIQLTGYSDRRVGDQRVADDGRSVFFTADRDGDEFHQIYRLWLDRGVTEVITDAPKSQHFFGGRASLAPNGDFLFTDNERTAAEFDVVVKNLRTGAVERPFPTGTLWGDPQFDPSYRRILAHSQVTSTDHHLFVFDRRRRSLTEILPHDTDASVWAVDWTSDGKAIFALTDIDSDFRYLVRCDLATGKSQVLAAPTADVEAAGHARGSRTLTYAVNEGGYSVIYAGRAGGRFRRIRTPRGAIPFTLLSDKFTVAPSGKFAVALWGTGAAPDELLWIPLAHGSPRAVTSSMAGGVPDGPLPEPRRVEIPGPGGHKIPAWYYRPKRRPRGPIPAVLSVHGGPHLQERPEWGYSGLYAFLNSRGIAVIAPNIRGSTGYGKRYQRSIERDWGGAPVDDLRACAEWLRRQPEFDPARLAVFGASFGGFASLSCLTRLPEYWSVGVDVFGPSNLVTFLRSIPPSWRKGVAVMLGDPDVDAERLLAHSPITYLDRIRADLLVIQGAKDPRVVRAESDQLVERLRAAGRHVEYTVFEDEGHGFTRQANAIRASRLVGNFLTHHLVPSE